MAGKQSTSRREFLESPQALAVAELVGAYLHYAKGYYRKNSKPSGEVENIKDAIQHLVPMYAKTLAADFGPTELRAVRRCMVDANLCRNVVNARVNRIRRIFKWAVGNQFVPTNVLQALQAVDPLIRGLMRPGPNAFNACTMSALSRRRKPASLRAVCLNFSVVSSILYERSGPSDR